MRHTVSLFMMLVVLGCNRQPVGDVTPKPAANDDNPKGDDKVGTWPVRQEYPGFVSQLWEYCVPYQADTQKALEELRQREFTAGRFYRSELRPKTFEDAIRNADAAGTRSMIDIEKVSPTRELLTISPAPPEKLRALFGTEKPSHAMVETASKKMSDEFQGFLEIYDRGEGLYIVLYEDDRPVEIYIAGWSCH
jgi:hypothetical protein